MSEKKTVILIIIINISFLAIKIISLIFSVWMNKSILICIYICFAIYSIFIILGILPYLLFKFSCKKIKFLLSINQCSCFIFYIFCLIEFITLSENIDKYKKYLVHCPFTLNKLNYDKHLKKRCELYNINNYSRYSYQYICSYDPSKEFIYNLKKDIKNDVLVCIPFKTLIYGNDIVSLFNNGYQNTKKYYCGRTKMPADNYTFIDPENCNDKPKYVGNVILFIFSMFQYLVLSFFLIGLNSKIVQYIKKELENERVALNIILNNNNQNNLNNRPTEDINLRLNNENRRLIALGALIDFFMELLARNPNTISRCSTDIEQNDNNNNNDNFDIQKTRNIIVENKNEYSIDIDIKNFSLNKDEKLTASKSIDLEQIQIDYIPNSEEKKINKSKENENNNSKENENNNSNI